MTRLALAGLLSLLAPFARADSAANLYLLHCAGCHLTDGSGSKIGRVPPFPGMLGPIAGAKDGRAYVVLVPGVANTDLSDADAAAVLNYALAQWGGDATFKPYTADEVRAIRTRQVDDIADMRRRIAAELKPRGVSIDY
ncbi:MAG: cytochrome c [Beijerinckiaceae bacterium]